jgi:hypothetical protein
MSSKASGEPALMASASVIMAIQQATAAAAHDIATAASVTATTITGVTPAPEPQLRGTTMSPPRPVVTAAATAKTAAAAARVSGGGGAAAASARGAASGGVVVGGGNDSFLVLPAPATPQRIKSVVGRFSVAELLQKAMEGGGAMGAAGDQGQQQQQGTEADDDAPGDTGEQGFRVLPAREQGTGVLPAGVVGAAGWSVGMEYGPGDVNSRVGGGGGQGSSSNLRTAEEAEWVVL